MAYVTLDEMKAIVPAEVLSAAVDDGNFGADVELVWPLVAEAASRRVDGVLGGRYTVPFSAPLPALVREAALVFSAYLLFVRRQAGDKNPYAKDAETMMTRLERVADGLADLSASETDAAPAVISEPAATFSAAGRLML
jgi:phage gp36-like protein